ncbi:glycosyltransferase WbsX family protein [Ectobacillus panaciterrae]|uniref:glycosyltransferase WbsX family protein n=1 Tax=Ectobacillus panaciterrae TaxID=363872 RepID=UPI00040E8E92|nr:glycoside hydrolase family 99-like domain-containing protein [Ectobacillus panaciterrae]
MKTIAFYLPQFHQIPENDKWWGEGFTEWTNTRKAMPLFPEHYQPREPYNDFYYDLTRPEVRKWQADIAKQHGIHGFCYYHYWFKGKRLLERPFNEVLKSGQPDFPFCLSWANEPWTRSWDGLEHNVLMPQDYGGKEDWKEHFDYLIQAFQDKRYIRVDDKPLFIIYRPDHIPRCEEMLAYWNVLAKQNGLKGIFFVETLNSFSIPNTKGFDASVEFEPMYTLIHGNCSRLWKAIHGYGVIDYDKVWECILNRHPSQRHKKVFPGAFVDWDNTPRKGANGGVFVGSTPEKFYRYLTMQIQRAKFVYKSEFLFINAWNEWAEGAYLEPDKRYNLQYLESVKKALQANGVEI